MRDHLLFAIYSSFWSVRTVGFLIRSVSSLHRYFEKRLGLRDHLLFYGEDFNNFSMKILPRATYPVAPDYGGSQACGKQHNYQLLMLNTHALTIHKLTVGRDNILKLLVGKDSRVSNPVCLFINLLRMIWIYYSPRKSSIDMNNLPHNILLHYTTLHYTLHCPTLPILHNIRQYINSGVETPYKEL